VVIDWSRNVDVEPPHNALATVTAQASAVVVVAVAAHRRTTAREPLIESARMVDVEYAGVPVILQRPRNVGVDLHIRSVALVIQLLLCSGAYPCKAIPASGRRPLSCNVGEHPLVIRTTENAHVVCFESGTAPVLRRLIQPVTGLFCEARVETIPVQGRARRIVTGREQPIARFVASYSLIVSSARLLGTANCSGVARDAGDRTLEVE